MEMMDNPMSQRCKQNARGRNEHNPAEQCIKRRKKFSRHRLNGVHGAHPRQNHSRIEGSVEPGKVFGKMITKNAQTPRGHNKGGRHGNAPGKADKKSFSRQEWLVFTFEHRANQYRFAPMHKEGAWLRASRLGSPR